LAPRSRSPPDPLAPALFPYTTLFRSMHQAFLQQNFDLPPVSVPCHIVNSSEAFVQLARQGTTCCMIPHLQIEKELASGELIDLTPGLFQRRMLYWHRFAPESRMMRKVTDALLDYGHKVLRQD